MAVDGSKLPKVTVTGLDGGTPLRSLRSFLGAPGTDENLAAFADLLRSRMRAVADEAGIDLPAFDVAFPMVSGIAYHCPSCDQRRDRVAACPVCLVWLSPTLTWVPDRTQIAVVPKRAEDRDTLAWLMERCDG